MNDTISLATALRTVTSKMFKKLKQQQRFIDDFSFSEITVLLHLYNNEKAYPSELAPMLSITTQSVSEILNKLEERKIITRTPSETDKRKTEVSLSAYGRESIEISRNDRDQWLAAAIEANLDAKEKETIKDAVAIMRKLAESK